MRVKIFVESLTAFRANKDKMKLWRNGFSKFEPQDYLITFLFRKIDARNQTKAKISTIISEAFEK